VIAVTADAMPDCRERCLEAGMNDYITKPVKAETLDLVLSKWLPPEQTEPVVDNVAEIALAGPSAPIQAS
jgi:DNA-binding response OmpR family regulator